MTHQNIIAVQSFRDVQLFATPWNAARQASLSFTISWSLLKFMSTESVILSNHLVLCRPLLLLPSIFPSIREFSTHFSRCVWKLIKMRGAEEELKDCIRTWD